MAREAPCPSCGAPVRFLSSVALLAVCPHCRSQLFRQDLNLEALGKSAELVQDGSVIQVGTEGRFRNVAFAAVGRLQMRFDDGLWNEWFLVFDNGDQGWLGEAQGKYAVSFRRDPDSALPSYDELAVGRKLTLQGKAFEVVDLRTAEYLAAEGELPFKAPLGEKASLADLTAEGGGFATLDYSEEKPLLFFGQWATPEELALKNLRVPEGW
ncbi:DUF4178 domain-containing protein [bacterium]|nr:MAG: DUF4178 domain-containing protein [bacterium]